MPVSVLTRKRSLIAWFAVLAMIASLMAIAQPAGAHSVARDTSATCPSTIPNAGFNDISAFDAETQHAINCIAFYGVSIGTTATTFSPSFVTLRRHMALFLIRSASDMGITIPAPSNQGFQDISTLPQEEQDAINQLGQLGITKGTSTTTFSPNEDVDRWEMALFLHRLLTVAGFNFADASCHTHTPFVDVATLSQEARDAIQDLSDCHIALGVGLGLYAPFDAVARWQMALFLTRTLAADGVIPTGLRVSVTPTEAAVLATGQARTYSATFRNADGTNYTGAVGVQLVEASNGAPVYNDLVDNINIEAVSDGLVISAGGETATGTAGTDGQVTFTIRHTGAAEDVIPVAWEDLNGDGDPDNSGNTPPAEPFALGGLADFVAGPAGEAADGVFAGAAVTKTTKASDVFEATGGANCAAPPCSYFYDANDVFTVGGLAATLQQFEDALNVNDTFAAGSDYDPDPADQSTFNLTNVPATFAVTTPSAATTVNADTFAIMGTGQPGGTVTVYSDADNDADGVVVSIDGGDTPQGTGTVNPDGAWTVTVALAQNQANNFQATQLSGGVTTPAGGAALDVPTITDATSAGATILSTNGANGGVAGILDPGDTIIMTFSEDLAGVGGADSISLVDGDGTTLTLTHGVNSTFALADGPDADPVADDAIVVTVNIAVPGSGGTTGGVQPTASITAVGGFTDDDNEAINVGGSPDRNAEVF